MEESNILTPETEVFMHLILFSALKKISRSCLLRPVLKKKVMFLITPVNLEDMSIIEKGNLLGLPPQMMSELNTVHFTQSELLEIQKIFYQELPKVLKELSETVIGISGTSDSLQTLNESCVLAQNLNNLTVDNNEQIEENVKLQKNLITLKHQIIPGKELKMIQNFEKNLESTLIVASDLHERTLNTIYPSEDFYDKIKDAASGLEEELSAINKEIQELCETKELYQKVDQQELMGIVRKYKDVTREIQMRKMIIKEVSSLRLEDS